MLSASAAISGDDAKPLRIGFEQREDESATTGSEQAQDFCLPVVGCRRIAAVVGLKRPAIETATNCHARLVPDSQYQLAMATIGSKAGPKRESAQYEQKNTLDIPFRP